MRSGLRSDPQEWTDERHRQGLAAEQQAIRYLASRGWFVLAHRFRAGRIEIDLIARRGRLVAFVEVKARRSDAFGSPLEAVTGAKRRGIVKGARAWGGRIGAGRDGDGLDCNPLTGGRVETLGEEVLPGG